MRTRVAKSKLMLRRGRAQRGFTLIELLIVVAIILVIAAIAVPSLLRARMAANESSAVAHVRAITTAATVYSTQWNDGYPPNFGALGGIGFAASCDSSLLLDQLLTAPPNLKAGYVFSYAAVGPAAPKGPGCGNAGAYSYLVTATPSNLGYSGQRSFCSDLPAVIHYDMTGATAASTAACDALPSL